MAGNNSFLDQMLDSQRGATPELELRAKLAVEAYSGWFGMMSKAWTGWPEEKKDQTGEKSQGRATPNPLEGALGTINEEIMKGVSDLYKSVTDR